MRRDSVKKIQGAITVVLAIVAVVVAGVGLLASVPKDGPVRILIVRTGSMAPTLPVGSLVVIGKQAEYGVGDIVTYKAQDNFVTHRIISVADGKYQTKGDANNVPDGTLIASSAVVGKLRLSVPYVGSVVTFARTPLGFSLLIVLPALAIVMMEILAIGKELERTRPRVVKGRRRSIVAYRRTGVPTWARRRVGFISTWSRTTLLLVACLSLVGGTKAYFSNLGLSSNNVFNTSQFIATTLVINELIYDSSCTPNPDQKIAIELWNGSGTTVSLQNWKLRDQDGNIVQTANSNTDLPPGQFAMLSKSGNTWQAACYGNPPTTIRPNLGGTIVINTTSGFLELLDPSNAVIDKVAYGSPNPSAAEDKSIERKRLGFDTATGSNFNASDFISQFPATLGFALPTTQTVVINEFMLVPNSGSPQEFIELRNNSAASVDISNWKVFSDDGTTLEATVPASTTLLSGQRYLHQYVANGNEISDTNDKLILKDVGSVIQDAFSYHKFAPVSGTSWSRIPEGTNTWVLDSSETPGGANVL